MRDSTRHHNKGGKKTVISYIGNDELLVKLQIFLNKLNYYLRHIQFKDVSLKTLLTTNSARKEI